MLHSFAGTCLPKCIPLRSKSTYRACRTAEEIRAKGGAITREPAPIAGVGGTKVMKTADPDGWGLAFVDNTDFLLELCRAGKLEGAVCEQAGAS